MNFIFRYIYSLLDFLFDFVYSCIFNKILVFKKSNVSVVVNDNKNSSFIGEGAFSTVYRGSERYNKSKLYAVKRIFVQSKDFEQMVQTEIDAFNRFKHRNILKMIDYYQEENKGMKVTYMLFPYIKNGSLRNLLTGVMEGYLPKPHLVVVLNRFLEICNAFNVLHTYTPNYVHQDIKPENILIDNDGTPLLTDFGSVRLADVSINTRIDALNLADQAAQYCTASYRAPELFDPKTGSQLDTRTDVWGIGCLLFAWWFGYSPFECEFHGSTFKVVECTSLRILSPIPRSTRPSADDQLIIDLVEWILEKDYQKRPFTTDIIHRVQSITKNFDKNKRKVEAFEMA